MADEISLEFDTIELPANKVGVISLQSKFNPG